jgi:predicted enzyme related to lactoylglutathione lyase
LGYQVALYNSHKEKSNKMETKEEFKRVTSIGGVFFKAKDPKMIREWYGTHLGLVVNPYGSTFEWRHADDPEQKGFTAWAPFKETTDYFNPGTKDFMVNYRVDNLEKLLEALKEEGVQVVGEIQVVDYGKFGWIMDPEGNKIELWEPIDSVYATMGEGKTTK